MSIPRGEADPIVVDGVLSLPTPPGIQGEPGHDTATATKRRVDAVSLRLAGATYQQIAEHLGVTSPASARNLVMRALQEVEQEQVREYRLLENARLDSDERVLRAIISDPTKPDERRMKAIDARLRVAKRRADLNGLDAPKQVQVSAGVMAEMEQAFGELRLVVMGEVIEPDEPDEMDVLEG